MISGDRLLEEILNKTTLEHRLEELDELSFELTYSASIDLEQEREKIQFVLKSQFMLETIHPDLDRFLILRFPGVDRQLSQQGLYAVAAELAERLDVVAVIPEASESYPVEGPYTETVTTEAALLKENCLSKVDTTLTHDWVGKFVKLEKIWQSNKGAGITIVQPDTGVTTHQELAGALDLDRAYDAITDKIGEATDPLTDSMRSPGHGTALSSVIASDHHGLMSGIAPDAALVPVRCMNSVILWSKAKELAKAIVYAGEINADIVSMSLGGIRHNSVQEAIQQVVDKGLIVVAAAGNCVGVVVHPASDRNSIGVAGCGSEDNAWKGTSHGRRVDVTAPGENVFAARRSTASGDLSTVSPGQGTSYSAAITAGVAALWLAHHGKVAVRECAVEKSTSVNELYRCALKQTARPSQSDDWKNDMGGILDAESLMELDLSQIDLGLSTSETFVLAEEDAQAHEVYQKVSELAERGELVEGFDWARHGPEVTQLAKEALGRSSPSYNGLVESSAAPMPSTQLSKSQQPAIVAKLARSLEQSAQAGTYGAASFGGVDNLFADLAKLNRGGLESNGASFHESVESSLSAWMSGGGLEGLESRCSSIVERLNAQDVTGSEERQNAMQNGLEALQELQQGRPLATFDIDSRIGLESLVRLQGRPAFRLQSGKITSDDPMFDEGNWGPMLSNWQGLPKASGAVGRINRDGIHIGTGFLFSTANKRNLVMTNRHVLEALAEEVRTANGSDWIFSDSGVTIDFSDMGLGGEAFSIDEVVYAHPNRIRGQVILNNLDLVVLKIQAHENNLPQSLELSTASNVISARQKMLVIGYPAEPNKSDFVDPDGDESEEKVAAALGRIFGIAYGSKHLSPGEVITETGGLERDIRDWVFAHDATTLGGSSGSMIMLIGADEKVAGIHFAGKVLTQNLSHQISRTGLMEKLS